MGCHDDIQDMYRAIEAMMIIHNICIDWNDKPEDIWDFDAEDRWLDGEDEDEDANVVGSEVVDGDVEVPLHETDNWLLEQGRQKGLILMNELFPV